MSDERVAALEAHRQGDQASIEALTGTVNEIRADVQIIKLQLEKQKGFIAGCLFILVPIWTAIVAAVVAFWEWFKAQ